jgi:hypothetical protein
MSNDYKAKMAHMHKVFNTAWIDSAYLPLIRLMAGELTPEQLEEFGKGCLEKSTARVQFQINNPPSTSKQGEHNQK